MKNLIIPISIFIIFIFLYGQNFHPVFGETRSKYRLTSAKTTNLFSQKTNKLLPEPQTSLLNGILWGSKETMPSNFYEALRRTGTLHIIALSGMNITILVALIGKLTLFWGRKKSILLTLLSIFVFIGFVGPSASVVRAGIMGSLTLIAIYFGRRDWSLLSLVLAAGIMLIFFANWLTDVGFQLSFLATLGIILFASKPESQKARGVMEGILKNTKENLRITLAAQIFTLPVMLITFKQLSLVAPVTNVLVLWIVQPIMILGFVLSLVSLVFSPLAYPLAWIIWLPLTYFIEVVKLTAKLPFASLSF